MEASSVRHCENDRIAQKLRDNGDRNNSGSIAGGDEGEQAAQCGTAQRKQPKRTETARGLSCFFSSLSPLVLLVIIIIIIIVTKSKDDDDDKSNSNENSSTSIAQAFVVSIGVVVN